jgi:hypothetical protein
MGMRGEYLNPQICPLCHGPSKTGRMCAGCKSRNTEVRVTYLKPAPQPPAPEPGSLTDLEFWRAAGARGPYTYLVQCVLGGPVKVGTAVDPDKRLVELQTGSPYPLGVLHVLPCNCEALLHRRFSDWRLCGEWFANEDRLIAEFREVAGILRDQWPEDLEDITEGLVHTILAVREVSGEAVA